jgi:hypothetical protein
VRGYRGVFWQKLIFVAEINYSKAFHPFNANSLSAQTWKSILLKGFSMIDEMSFE